jgi:hypothetical protein
MWILRVALDRPYTFTMLALLILLLSPVVILSQYPAVRVPVNELFNIPS